MQGCAFTAYAGRAPISARWRRVWVLTGFDKVFCLGLPKTGLTSVLGFMSHYGFHPSTSAWRLRKAFFKKDFEALKSYYDEGSFFCDIPTPFVYEALFESYGASQKYILSVRSSETRWYESLLRHNIYAHPVRHKHRRTFGRYYPHGFRHEHIAFYRAHNERVAAFFRRHAPENFLILDVSQPEAVDTLCDFLGFEKKLQQFPKENISAERRETASDIFKRRYNRLVQPVYGRIAPRIGRSPARHVEYLKHF